MVIKAFDVVNLLQRYHTMLDYRRWTHFYLNAKKISNQGYHYKMYHSFLEQTDFVNTCTFDIECFLQLHGAAMFTKCRIAWYQTKYF